MCRNQRNSDLPPVGRLGFSDELELTEGTLDCTRLLVYTKNMDHSFATYLPIVRGLSKTLSQLDRNLSVPQIKMLLEIAMAPGLSVNEMSERTSIPQQTVSRNLGILQGRYMPVGADAGYQPKTLISMTISTDDPRRRALYLTEDGAAVVSLLINGITATALEREADE